MSTNYPNEIDNFGPDRTDNTNTKIPGSDVNNLRHAVVAIQNELGTEPSGSFPTVKDRITNIETSYGKKDGTLQTNLNADKVDGYHATEISSPNSIPVSGSDGRLGLGWGLSFVSGTYTGNGTNRNIALGITGVWGFVGNAGSDKQDWNFMVSSDRALIFMGPTGTSDSDTHVASNTNIKLIGTNLQLNDTNNIGNKSGIVYYYQIFGY